MARRLGYQNNMNLPTVAQNTNLTSQHLIQPFRLKGECLKSITHFQAKRALSPLESSFTKAKIIHNSNQLP